MKTKPTNASAQITAAWKGFFDSQKLDDEKAVREQGWKSPSDLATLLSKRRDAARQLCIRKTQAGLFESKKFRLRTKAGEKIVVYYRPKPCRKLK